MRERPTRLIALTQVFCESKTLPKGKIQEHLGYACLNIYSSKILKYIRVYVQKN